MPNNEPITTIIEGPCKATTSYGNWSVWLRDTRPDGSVVEYAEQFMRKRDAQRWIADFHHSP